MFLKNTLLFFWEILKVVILALVIVVPIRYFIFQPFVVRGISMTPTFHNGDYLIVDELSYRFKEPQRGEVIVFSNPANPSEKFIKRIIGLPDEKITLKGNDIIISDKFGKKFVLDESSYLDTVSSLENEEFSTGSEEYFVLGDNRLSSFDSRKWGCLKEELIIGRVFFRVFPARAAAYFPAPSY